MLTSYAQFKSYFRQLATDHVDINTYVFGGVAQLIALRNSTMNCPVMWLETPDVVKLRGGETQRFAARVMILTNSRQDYDEEDVKIEEMKVIADDIYLRIKHDAQQGEFNFGDTETVMQPKFRQGSDNDLGWVIDFDVTLGDDACYNPAKFGQ